MTEELKTLVNEAAEKAIPLLSRSQEELVKYARIGFERGASFMHDLVAEKHRVEVEDSYNKGFLKGSEIGDNTARKFRDEANSDMKRWQEDRLTLQSKLAEEKEKARKLVEGLRWYNDNCGCAAGCSHCEFAREALKAYESNEPKVCGHSGVEIK